MEKKRLNYGSSWFEHNHLFIRTKLKDIHKTYRNKRCNFCFTFMTISEVQHFSKIKEINTHQQALNRCIEYMSQNIDENKVSILIGHLTIKGGKTSDSERPLTIGTVESVERQSFDQFEYVMLGHLHHPFSVNENIKYSGSLLQYSFSEVNQAKGYRIVNIDEVNHVEDTFKSIEPLRELEVIDGDYDDVIEERVSVKNKDNYFHFKLTNMSHINDPMMKLKQIYPNTLALTNHTFEHIEEFNNVEIKKQDDQSIIKSFYESMTKEEISETQSNKIAEILNNIMRKEV